QDGVTGALDAPAGRWDVIVHPGSAITARVSAGGEAFDARLAGGIAGTWTGDPHDLRAPMAATVGVDAASVDTGIAMRSKSARDDYLRAAEFPRLEFTLDRLIAARPDGDRRVAFRAAGTLAMIGGRVAVEVTGTLTVLDDAARARLDLDPAAPAMLAVADLSVPIAATALADDAGDLDGDHLPIHVQLVLVHRATPTAPESP
ncbi:MAG: YceI family protein, partial [Myxococcales bacterium]|nr:YceI family protein [Myxococcales bacterium]